MKKSKYNWHVKECRRLRSAYSNAGVDYFVGIMHFEDDKSAWKIGVDGNSGWPTFLDCLHAIDAVMAHRYEKFKQKVEVCGSVEAVREIGMSAAEKLLATPDDVPSIGRPEVPARQAVHEEYIAFRRRNEQPVSERHARSIREKHFRSSKVNIEPLNEFDRLKVENRKLKKEVAKLKKELAKAQAESLELKKLCSVKPRGKTLKRNTVQSGM